MKTALIGFCAIALLLNTGCSSSKSAAKTDVSHVGIAGNDKTASDNNAAISDNNEKLAPVAEAPIAPRRPTWGSNISPYFN